MRDALTVIMPVRDAAPTVRRAVGSTLRALPASGRLLVHDDASTDATAAVLRSVDDPRLRVVTSPEPVGVARGLNRLLAQVRTPVVARMDADDITLPDRFRAQIGAVRQGADVVFSTVVGFGDVPGRIRPGPPIPISASAFGLHLLLANPVAHSTMLARTDAVVDAGGYREVAAEDYDLWLRLGVAGHRVVRLGRPTLLYRCHARQLTAAADWAARARGDAALTDAYAGLSRAVLGREPTWYADLPAGGPGSTDPAAGRRLADFAGSIRAAAAELSTFERRVLCAKLDRLVAA